MLKIRAVAMFKKTLPKIKSWVPFKETIIRTVGWGLIALSVITFYLSRRDGEPVRDALLPVGVLIALSGAFFSQARDLSDNRQKISLFHLQSALEAFKEAQGLLEDGNNDRATWIAAGRALEHAKHLSGRVSLKAHRDVLEVNRLRYRRFFGQLLQAKPAAFFYGVKIEDESLSLDEAAKLSSKGQGGWISFNSKLSNKSLHAVWEAAQWPEDYKDPLGRDFTREEMGKLMVLYDSLHQFLEHENEYASASGKLFLRKDYEKTR